MKGPASRALTMLKTTTESMLAIDLAAEAVRILDVTVRKGEPRVTGCASQTVAAGTPETLPARQLEAVQGIVTANRMKTKRCVAAVPTSLVVTRSVTIDHSKSQSADEQIRATLQNCLPFDPSDLIFDHWPVGDPKANARSHEILVVATRSSVVKQYLDGFKKIGLDCVHLDVAPCAMATLISRAAGNGEAMAGTVVIGETSGYFAIVEREKVLFWRPFDVPAAAQKVISAVQAGLDRVGDEISKCVSHMVGSMHLDNLTELLVYGHGSDDAAFTDYLKNRFHLPVRSPSPFDALSAESFSPDLRSAIEDKAATYFAVAVGLAMQPVGVSNNG